MTEKPAKVKPGLPVGGSGHPRTEAAGLSSAVTDLFSTPDITARCAEPVRKSRPQRQQTPVAPTLTFTHTNATPRSKSWARLEQALKVTDLLLQAGGFSCIVLDLGSMQAEYALRVPLATWFRFRAAIERSQANFLLLTQHACSKSSAGLVLRFEEQQVLNRESTVFSGVESQVILERQRFPQSSGNVLPLRKQPQNVHTAQWQSQAVWAGRR